MQFIYCCRYKFDKLNVVAFYGIVYNHPKNAETFREIHVYIPVHSRCGDEYCEARSGSP